MIPTRPQMRASEQSAPTVPAAAAQQVSPPSEATLIAAIRKTLGDMPTTPFKRPFPLAVAVDGAPTLPLMARIDSLARNGSKGVVHLATLKRGRLFRGGAETWISSQFLLTGKDELKPGTGLPRAISDDEAARFFAHFQDPTSAPGNGPPTEENFAGEAPRPRP